LDTEQIYKYLLDVSYQNDKALHSVFKENGNIKAPVVQDISMTAYLCKVVASQQLSSVAAATIWSRVSAQLKLSKVTLEDFLVEDNIEKLRNCGLSKNKVKAMLSIKEKFITDTSFEEKVKRIEQEDFMEELTSIWGVGTWTAEMLGMFYLGKKDFYPLNDAAIKRGVTKLCGNERHVKSMPEYAPYRTYLCLHVWHAIDNFKL
jgi:DNA-3-methyladenine glycosylase II